jgi:nucleoside-diphosphate-sugar epimerase
MRSQAVPENDWASSYRGRSVLITGGASFIGCHLSERLIAAGAAVRVADDLSSGRHENLADLLADLEFLKGDLRDPVVAKRALAGQELVFHLAAIHGGRGFVDTHGFECLGNTALDNIVFTAAAAAGVRRIVFASSACVYPTYLQGEAGADYLLNEEDTNFVEPGKVFPDGDYGWAKLIGELQLRALERDRGTEGVACRLFSVYGDGQGVSHSVTALIAKALAREDPLVVWGSGRQTRNLTHIDDAVRGLIGAGAAPATAKTVNIGSEEHISVERLCESILELLKWRPSAIEYDLTKPVGVVHRAADARKARELFGWEPEVPLGEGLQRTIEWCASAGLQLSEDALFARG